MFSLACVWMTNFYIAECINCLKENLEEELKLKENNMNEKEQVK